MVFEKVMLVYGVPEEIMGCGEDVSGEGICISDLPCACGMCRYEFRDKKKDFWIWPCCSKVKYGIRGIKIDSVERNELDIKYTKTEFGDECIDTAHYVSSTGKRYEINDIFRSMVFDPDFEVSDENHQEWDQIRGDCREDPKVYLVLDDCTWCT